MQQLLQMAVEGKADVGVLERLAKMHYDQQDREARIGFDDALNRCQGNMKRIGADMTNPQTHSKYASYAALDKAIRPVYTEEGFSISFGEDEGSTADYIVMLAYLSRGGHTRTYRKGMPIDTKGPKGNDVMTKTHAAGSGGSYAKRYLLKDIFNLAVGEEDDDGNGGLVKIPADKVGEWLKALGESTDLTAHMKLWGKIYTTANELGDKNALDILIPAYEAKKAELSGTE
jgi:hypothetical protein